MRKWQVLCVRGACSLMAAGMIFGAGSSMAATSSCVQCHTDEDMLVENLSQVKKKGSAMTSGAG